MRDTTMVVVGVVGLAVVGGWFGVVVASVVLGAVGLWMQSRA